jgi:branched-chain amino acid transport system ATP-binding protein
MFLEVKNLNVGYGDVQVLWDVSFSVDEGMIVSLVGANGAGKTTLLKTISGLIRPMSGEILFEGKPLTSLTSKEIVEQGVIHVPEGRRLFPEMTVEENLLMGAFRRKKDPKIQEDLERVYEIFPRLKERRKQKSGSMSGGEQQMCAMARGLMGNPKLLLVDEMSLGLAPLIVDDLIDIVKDIHRQGTTVFIVEQDVHLALSNSDYGYVLATGHIMMEGKSQDLLANKKVKEVFLGL